MNKLNKLPTFTFVRPTSIFLTFHELRTQSLPIHDRLALSSKNP